MGLEQWLANSWIKPVRRSAQDVADLLAIGDREIGDGSLEGISTDGRFVHAYDAVRSLAEAALHASGYAVPKGQRKHERLIESLRFTLSGDVARDVDFFDQCRRLRHKTVYERVGVLRQRDADELLEAAKDLRNRVRQWLRDSHPDLVSM